MKNNDHVYMGGMMKWVVLAGRRIVSWWETHILKVCGKCSGKIACHIHTSTPDDRFYPQL